MNNSKEEIFKKRFGSRVKFLYSRKTKDVEEQRFRNSRINEAIITVLTDILGRKPTTDEIWGIVPITVKNNSNKKETPAQK